MHRVDILKQKLKVINVGVKLFYEALKAQGVATVHVSWQPPAGGDRRMVKLLEKLTAKRRQT